MTDNIHLSAVCLPSNPVCPRLVLLVNSFLSIVDHTNPCTAVPFAAYQNYSGLIFALVIVFSMEQQQKNPF